MNRDMLIDRYESMWFIWKARKYEQFWLAISWACGRMGNVDAAEKYFWKAQDWWERGWECSKGM